MNHKWDKGNNCVKCGIHREKQTVKTLMAIHKGRDMYKYQVKYKYFTESGETFTRPLCWRTTYDN